LAANTLLKIENLVTVFNTEQGKVRAVDDIIFELEKGQTLGLVGESGCGKSVTALSIMRLLPKPSGIIESGNIFFDDMDITKIPAEKMHEIRGNRIAMIFQEPMTALNPVHRLGDQLKEAFHLHFSKMKEEEIREEALKMLQLVGIPEPEERMREYAHQVSGGMRQRIMIAMALACKPDLLIADEPTTALDVTIQAQILELMKTLQQESGMAILFITHDLGVIAEMCQQVVVMYAGKIMETTNVRTLFAEPKHPYTLGLLASIPRLDGKSKAKLTIIDGMVPSLLELPPGCRFQNRCPRKMNICETAAPPMIQVGEDHWAACYLYGQ